MRIGSLRIPGPHALIAAVSAIAVVALALVDVRRTSPGELAGVHARVDGLDGRLGCAECHGGWGTSMSEACLDCHETIAGDLEAGEGLHGLLERDGEDTTCARCHSDHHGEGFPLVNAQSFRQSGFEAREDFDHALIGFAMSGTHLETECASCHENVDEPLLPEGGRRFGGLEASCAACHEDPHEGEMKASCTACHSQVTFDHLASDAHDFLPLVGSHGAAACTDCHDEGTAHGLEALGRSPGRTPRGCVACHEDPHDATFVRRIGASDLFGMRDTCSVCHDAVHESFVPPDESRSRDLHALTGFPLADPHEGLSCAECHAPEESFAERYPGRGADDCQACHADPHGGQFEEYHVEGGAFGGRGCLACHDRHAFEPPAFGVEEHAGLALPLEGRHAAIECSACHEMRGARPREFHGTSAACSSCHADAHRGFFEDDGGRCGDCHVPTAFSDPGPTPFDHAEEAGFAILGAHAQGECEACHRPRPEPDDTGRVFGWIEEHFGVYEGCASCHEDPHEGRFDGPGRRVEVDGRRGCARCHDQASFRSFPNGFDHELWTGFELSGAHGRIDCSACHAPLPLGPSAAGTLGPVKGTRCSDCHADPHAGQFREGGRTTCYDCHRSTRNFAALYFDHDDSDFPLDDAHRRVRCQECHKPWRVSEGLEVIRYKPLDTDCASCHGTHTGPVLEGRR